jgi:hypothetical protein
MLQSGQAAVNADSCWSTRLRDAESCAREQCLQTLGRAGTRSQLIPVFIRRALALGVSAIVFVHPAAAVPTTTNTTGDVDVRLVDARLHSCSHH